MCMTSPKARPMPAPILKTGMNDPDGTGMVDAIMEKTKVKRMKPARLTNTLEWSVLQCLKISTSWTVNSSLVHVKLVNSDVTCKQIF